MTDIDRSRIAADAETIVRARVTVGVPIEHAFRVFTADMSAWWPRTHHIGAVPMSAAIVEPRAGGRWFELGDDGSQCDWGIVLAWDPPHHVALSWHLDGDFRYQRDGGRASRVDVRFRSESPTTTIVELEHSGLDRHGPTWRRLRDQVTGGWATILGIFARTLPTPPES
ncbi:MAG TPA: SRPBCC family protein [Candidatus Limnocylindrales bacterium]|nr:SRPBCC family protein [Candidatus Limnocylindrales bacterium]